MNRQYYLAVDIGASSGRHMLSHTEDGKMILEEIYRFENGMKMKDGHLCWDIPGLFAHILTGLAKCKESGKLPVSMAIDTWGVDYVLLDADGEVIGETYGYRDWRTDGMDDKVSEVISPEELYARTGIQKQMFNTIYQLMAVKEQEPENMEKADCLMFVPDYFNYLLTGVKRTEYTEATTGQLVNAETGDWDWELIDMLGLKKSIFGPITMPGTTVGNLKAEIEKKVGFNLEVIQAAAHDTGSAVMSVPAKDPDFLYISSGTWSLMGVEQRKPDCSEKARKANLTNEGGYEKRYRFLKNIMGLWMIQSARHEWNDRYSFGELCEMAEACTEFPSRVDVNDESFLAPDSMLQAIREYCARSGQPIPEEPGEFAAVIYQSLADCYGRTVREIEEITGRTYHSINIVGGGANAEYLNRLTAKATGKTVYSGPTEATAIGNITAQMIKNGEFESLEEARSVIFDSFEIKCFE